MGVEFRTGFYKGFLVRDLAELRHILDEQAWTFEHALEILRYAGADLFERREREWREHFGVLCEVWKP